ncbi:glutamine rich nitrogen starvation-induced [Apiospora arundinis]
MSAADYYNGGGGGGSGGAYPPQNQYSPQPQYGHSPSPYPPQQQYTPQQSSTHLSPYPSHPQYARPSSAHSDVGFPSSGGPPPPRYEQQGGHLAPYNAPPRPHSAEPYAGGHYDEKRGTAGPGEAGEDGERGLGASLIGGGAGSFLGHKLGKGKLGTFLGGAAGAVAANVIESKFKNRRNSHSSQGQGYGHQGGSQPLWWRRLGRTYG